MRRLTIAALAVTASTAALDAQTPAPPSSMSRLPGAMTSPPARKDSTARVTHSDKGFQFDFQDADIRSVITALASAGKLNVVYGDLPAKKVSLRLNQPVPASDIPGVLKNVALANGLKVSEDGGMITVSTVAPAAPPRRGPNFSNTELYVYRLKHANATTLASVLQGIFATGGTRVGGAGGQGTTGGNAANNRRLRGGTTGGGGGNFGGGGGGNLGGGGGGGRFGNGGGNGNAAGVGAAVPGGFVNPFQGLAQMFNATGANDAAIVIVPDDMTNSLLVRAAPDDWDVIKQAIEAVDLRPLQVVIEVMIAEVQRNDDLQFGVSGSGTNARTSNGRTIGTGSIDPRQAPGDSSSNFIFNLSRRGGVDINLTLQALQTRGNVKILSLPLVFAQNNRESSLIVGSEQPFIQSFQTGLTDNGVQNQVVQYRDVGTMLDILPTINPDGYVNLQVYQEVSAATSQVQFSAPVISTRQAQASVFVKDGQTIVIGGLTDRQEQDIRSGIPLLSSIPWLGALFGSTHKISQRTELYLFLTPHIVMTDEDAEHVRAEVTKHSQLLHAIPVDSMRVIDPQDSTIRRRGPKIPTTVEPPPRDRTPQWQGMPQPQQQPAQQDSTETEDQVEVPVVVPIPPPPPTAPEQRRFRP